MKRVTSRDNRICKLCSRLGTKKYRDREGLYIAEGPNLVKELLGSGRLRYVVLEEGFSERTADFEKGFFEKASAGEDGRTDGPEIVEMPEKLFRDVADTVFSQGILGIVERDEPAEDDFFEHVGNGNVVVLDRLQDPGNVGTIIRTADAACYRGVIAMKGCVDIFSPKVVRAAAGSVFRVPVLFADTPSEAARLLKSHGKKILATSLDTDIRYYDVDMKKDTALIIGNEGNGICPEFFELADTLVTIPMGGVIESLNASVAAGILMYEAMRA